MKKERAKNEPKSGRINLLISKETKQQTKKLDTRRKKDRGRKERMNEYIYRKQTKQFTGATT